MHDAPACPQTTKVFFESEQHTGRKSSFDSGDALGTGCDDALIRRCGSGCDECDSDGGVCCCDAFDMKIDSSSSSCSSCLESESREIPAPAFPIADAAPADDQLPRLPMRLPKLSRASLVGLSRPSEKDPTDEVEDWSAAWARAEGEMGGALMAYWPEKRREWGRRRSRGRGEEGRRMCCGS